MNIFCSSTLHGPSDPAPVLGAIEGHTTPTAPYRYLCEACTRQHIANEIAKGKTEIRLPHLTPVTHLHHVETPKSPTKAG